MKKILTISIIILIILIAVVGVYFGFLKKPSLKADIEGIKISEIKMPFESGVGDLELNTFDIGAALPTNLFSDISVDTSLGGYKGGVQINLPTILVETPNWQPSGGPTINESTCAQFKTAPSCSFVPAQYQDLCQKCKAAGF